MICFEIKFDFEAITREKRVFPMFSIQFYRENGQNHVCRLPDMLPKVDRPKNAYLAVSKYLKQTLKKRRWGPFMYINVT